eukprot:SM000209S06372  [mRNA]  locus=s209:183230:186615:+ [translate_table: standard]
MFRECPHPDEKQRLRLSAGLGLQPRQRKPKSWKRMSDAEKGCVGGPCCASQAQTERSENSVLRAENERLRARNASLQDALKKACCATCGGPTRPPPPPEALEGLAVENARLRSELQRLSDAAAAAELQRRLPNGVAVVAAAPHSAEPGKEMLVGSAAKPTLPTLAVAAATAGAEGGAGSSQAAAAAASPAQMNGALGAAATRPAAVAAPQGRISDNELELVYELARAALEELLQMAQAAEPLWLRPSEEGSREILNVEEYDARFSARLGPPAEELSQEASRASGLVAIGCAALVDILLDAVRWSDIFPCLVSRAVAVDVVSSGSPQGGRSGALQLMYAELQVLSPLVPTREAFFLRYCKQVVAGCWAVADVSVDSLRSNPPPVMLRCRRRASGFVIREVLASPELCNVTVVEHVQADARAVHPLHRRLVSSTAAFGAHRWLAVLQRQCVRLAAMEGAITTTDIGITFLHGRKSMMRLAERMTRNFCQGVSASTQHQWTTLSGSGPGDVRVMTRKSVNNPGEPHGIILSAATSMWLSAPPKRVFGFLRDASMRSEWDILSNGGVVTEMAHMAKGQDPGNCVSLLKVQAPTAGQSNMLILQECFYDPSGSMIVYAPVDIPAMQPGWRLLQSSLRCLAKQVVIMGGDPDHVALLPSGFVVLPDASAGRLATMEQPAAAGESGETDGSLLTIAFQILVSSMPQAKLSLESVTTVNSLISCTVQRVRAALNCDAELAKL